MSLPSSGSPMPKPSAASAATCAQLVPDEPHVHARPMFGNPAAFVNGNLFTGLFGDGLFVRLSADDDARLHDAGGSDFAPMPGRPMRGYVRLPSDWATDLESARHRIRVSLDWVRALPAKTPRRASA